MKTKQLYQLSKYTYNEIFLESTLQQMGANQDRFMELLNKNKNHIQSQKKIITIFMFISSASLIFLPISAFLTIQKVFAITNQPHWLYFVGTLSVGLFFFISFGLLLPFGVMQSSTLLGGDAFKWLSTLPYSKKELEKVVFFTFFRGVRTQIIALLIVFPLGVAIASQNILVVLISIVMAIINLLFSFSILILVGERVNRIMQGNDVNTTKTNFIRISTIIGVGLGITIIVLVFSFALKTIDTLLVSPPNNANLIDSINLIASLIPFPFGGNYLMMLVFLGVQNVPPMLWATSLIGLALSGLITRSVFRKALSTLHNVIYFEQKKSTTEIPGKVKPIKIEALSPVRAYMKKDLSIVTRDFQMLAFLVGPIIMPIFGVIFVIISNPGFSDFTQKFFFMVGISIMYQMMGATLLICGFLTTEKSGASILSSLPIVIRDQVLGKVNFMVIIMPITAILPYILLFDSGNALTFLATMMVSIPLGPIFGLVALELKVRLFGKLKTKYILEEFHSDRKNSKWLVILAIEFGLAILMIASFTMLYAQSLTTLVIIFPIVEVLILGFLIIIFNRMFPKYQTEREN